MTKNKHAIAIGKLGGGAKHKPRTPGQYREQTRKANEATARKRAEAKAIATVPGEYLPPDPA